MTSAPDSPGGSSRIPHFPREFAPWIACAFLALWPAASALAALPANVELVTLKGPVSEYRLKSNGMPVLLVARHSAPVVSFEVVYHFGSRNESPGSTGSAHLLEHLLFNKSTAHYGQGCPKSIQEALHDVGADFGSTNMTTWDDRMTGYSTVPAEHLELAIRIEADRIRTGRLLDAERQPEMSVVRNEYEIGENDPGQVLYKWVVGTAIQAHPYHWDTIGYRSDIEGVSTARLREYYDTFFYPDNACAIIVGDFEDEQALALLDRYFGPLPKAPNPIPQVITVEPPQEGERRVTISRPGDVGFVGLGYLRPGTLHADWHALDVLSNILGSGRNARLYQSLVENGLATDVGTYNFNFRDPYLIYLYAQVAPGRTHAAVEAAERTVVDSLVRQGVSQAEVDRAARGIEVGLASRRDGVYDMCSDLGEAVASANWQWWVDYLDNIHKVTPADVQRVARTYLQPDRVTVGWFTPKHEDVRTGALPGGGHSVPGQGGVLPGTSGALLLPMVMTPAGTAPRAAVQPPGIEAGMSSGSTMITGPTKSGFAARTLRKVWPGRLILDIMPNDAAPTVAIAGQLAAGNIYAPAGQPEVAGLTASMLSSGTARYSKMEMARKLEDLGASLSLEAGPYDVTLNGYGMARDARVLLELLSEQLVRPTFPADEFEKARNLRKGQLLSQAENTGLRAREALARMAFPEGHPVRPAPIKDRAASLASLTLADVKAFHGKFYRGGSLVITVVGDVNPDSVIAWVEASFRDLPQGSAPELKAGPVAREAARQQVVTMKGKANMDLVIGTSGGLRRSDPDYYACLLANAALGQDAMTSRIGKRVRGSEGLSYSLYSRFFFADLLEGIWALDVAVAPQNLKKAMASSREEIARFCRDGMTQQELDVQKGYFSGNFKVRLATNAGVAGQLAFSERYGWGPDYLDEYPRAVQAVTLDQANAAVQKHWEVSRLHTVVAGDLEVLPSP